MAEIAQDSGGKGGKKRSKKMSTRIDMTPMCDLGFLLITFFVLVTTFSKPSAMDLVIPAKEDKTVEPPPIKESKVLQIVLGENDKLYYFRGVKDPKVDSIDFSKSEEVRKVFSLVGAKVQQKWGSDTAMIVLVKPMKKSKYKNMVDIMDEISIKKIKSYALVEFKPEDSIILFKGRQVGAGANSNLDSEQ